MIHRWLGKAMAKILMVVNNAGYGDWRVVKQAEQFVQKGWECTVLGLQKPGVDAEEIVAGVRYIRVPYKRNLSSLFLGLFPGLAKFLLFGTHKGADASSELPLASADRSLQIGSGRELTFSEKLKRSFVTALSLVERKVMSYIRKSKVLHPFFVKMTFGGYIQSFLPTIKNLDFDVIQAHEVWTLESCVLGSRGEPVIYDSHELETHRNLPWPVRSRMVLGAVERKYINKVSLVTAVSPGCAKYIRRLYKLKSVGVVRNLPLLSWLTKSSATIRGDLNLAGSDPLLIYTGNVTLNRGVESVLDALQYLDGVHFACVGNCNAEVKRGLEKKIEELGVGGRVHFLPPVSPGSLPHYISSGDLAVLPVVPACLSYRYCLPNKLFEAIHSNLFVLANELPDVKHVVLDNDLGAVCDFNNPVETAGVIQEALGRPKLDNRGLLGVFSFEADFDLFFGSCQKLCP